MNFLGDRCRRWRERRTGVDGLDDAGGGEQGTAKTRNSPMGTIGVSIICPVLDVTLQILISL